MILFFIGCVMTALALSYWLGYETGYAKSSKEWHERVCWIINRHEAEKKKKK